MDGSMDAHTLHISVITFHSCSALSGHAIAFINKLRKFVCFMFFLPIAWLFPLGVLVEIKTIKTEACSVCLSHKKAKIVINKNATTYNGICSSLTGVPFCG